MKKVNLCEPIQNEYGCCKIGFIQFILSCKIFFKGECFEIFHKIFDDFLVLCEKTLETVLRN